MKSIFPLLIFLEKILSSYLKVRLKKGKCCVRRKMQRRRTKKYHFQELFWWWLGEKKSIIRKEEEKPLENLHTIALLLKQLFFSWVFFLFFLWFCSWYWKAKWRRFFFKWMKRESTCKMSIRKFNSEARPWEINFSAPKSFLSKVISFP